MASLGFWVFSLFVSSALALPLCTDLKAPFLAEKKLKFCSYNGSSCCNATDDANVQKEFLGMNVSDDACGALVKSLLCTKCDPFSGKLFKAESKIRTVPVLCKSTPSGGSSQSKDSSSEFCGQVWDTCKDVAIRNSPFAPSLQGSTNIPSSSTSKLTELWQSKNDFCGAFGGSFDKEPVCFDGKTVKLNSSENPPAPKGMCLERLWKGAYLNMAAHPDGSNRVFLSSQDGKIWLAGVPEQGSGKMLDIDDNKPFVDLSDIVHYDTRFGMMGLVFHPNFALNGRFFASFSCDKSKTPSCAGRCSCNSEIDCDPTKIGSDGGSQPCQYQTVIAEFSANSTSSDPSSATSAGPSEVRRIFTMGLPHKSQNGGQILFGPDGYLYHMMGDGGGNGDPFNFAQNKKAMLGKIMRLDVDKMPSPKEITDLGLWGNYSIPKDNPYADDSELRPEIWAWGLRTPWRCSFDAQRPSYFFCGDVGQNTNEEVDLISKGGNYGWRIYEGTDLFEPKSSAGGNTSISSVEVIPPIMQYKHVAQSASITGGYVYRSDTDPCMFGRYLFGDLYATQLWAGTEEPQNSGNYNKTLVPFSCAADSPIPCDPVEGSPLPSLGYIFSFGQDNKKDVYLLTAKGVYRVVRPSRCNYSCPIERASTDSSPAPGATPSASSWSKHLLDIKFLVISLALVSLSLVF